MTFICASLSSASEAPHLSPTWLEKAATPSGNFCVLIEWRFGSETDVSLPLSPTTLTQGVDDGEPGEFGVFLIVASPASLLKQLPIWTRIIIKCSLMGDLKSI